jgi:hypothetical protein
VSVDRWGGRSAERKESSRISRKPQPKPPVAARIIVDDPASLVSDATANVRCGPCGHELPHLERASDVHALGAAGTLSFPVNFRLIAAVNPCSCGYYGDPRRACSCAPGAIGRYQKR